MSGGADVSVNVAGLLGSYCGVGYRGAALFSDEGGHYLLHPAGRHVAFRHADTGDAVFVPADEESEDISACAVSNNRSLLAVCERATVDPFVRVRIYDLQEPTAPLLLKSTAPVPGASAAARVLGASFSTDPDNRFLAIVTMQAAEVSLTVVEWNVDRFCGKCKLDSKVDRVTWSPATENCQVSVSGTNFLRIVQLKDLTSKIREPSLKVQPAFEGVDEAKSRITDHCWVESGTGIMACTSEGVVFLISEQEMRLVGKIQHPFGSDRQDAVPYCLYGFSQGFVLGGTDGIVSLWERVDDPPGDIPAVEQFQHARTARVTRDEAAICSMDMTNTEETLLIGTKAGNIGRVDLSAIMASQNGQAEITVLSGGYHAGPIASLDLAVQRPLAVTLGKKDNRVRVWNYATKQCEVQWVPARGDQPVACAIHPFGYFLAIAFQDHLCFFHLLKKELKLYREVKVRGIKLLKFSNGGHLLAAGQGKATQIFSTRTLKKVATLLGHEENVSAVCFDPEDQHLWTAGQDAVLIGWDLATMKRESTHTGKANYLAASSWAAGQVLATGWYGSRTVLERFGQGEQEHEYILPPSEGKTRLASLCHHPGSGLLLAGTTTGALRIYPLPAAQKGSRKEGAHTPEELYQGFTEHGLHAGALTGIRISMDGRTLITAGDDGTIVILEVSGITRAGAGGAGEEGAGEKSAAGGADGDTMAPGNDVWLIEKAEMDRRIAEGRMLRAETQSLKAKVAAEAQRLEEECAAKVAEARQKDQAEIEELWRRCRALESAQDAKGRESDRVMESMAGSHSQAKEQLSRLYEKKVSHEEERYSELEDHQASMQDMIDGAKEQLRRQMLGEEQKAQEELNELVAEKDLEIQKHKDFIAFLQHRFDNVLGAEGQEHDMEVAQTKIQAQQNLLEQKEIEARLRKEQETLLRGLEMMEQDRARIEKEEQDAMTKIRELKEQAEELTRMLNSLKAERVEREATLGDKEQRIESYKVKFNTLKKFKHVLDKRLAEVTESLQPKEKLISQLNLHLQEMEAEYEKQLVDARTMESALYQKRQQLSALGAEDAKLLEVVKERDRFIGRYTYDLNNLITEQPDHKVWPQEIRRMYHMYVNGERSGEDRLPLEEMQKQMRQVEKQVASLARKGGQTKGSVKADIQRKANESATLTCEVNELRMQKKSLQSSVRALQRKYEEIVGKSDSNPALSGPSTMQLEDGSARAESPPLPGCPAAPSGSLPGPRQVSSAGSAGSAGRTGGSLRKSGAKSVPPLQKKDPRLLRTNPEDQLRLQHVVMTEQVNRETLKVQKSENSLLRGQIDALMDPKSASSKAARA